MSLVPLSPRPEWVATSVMDTQFIHNHDNNHHGAFRVIDGYRPLGTELNAFHSMNHVNVWVQVCCNTFPLSRE